MGLETVEGGCIFLTAEPADTAERRQCDGHVPRRSYLLASFDPYDSGARRFDGPRHPQLMMSMSSRTDRSDAQRTWEGSIGRRLQETAEKRIPSVRADRNCFMPTSARQMYGREARRQRLPRDNCDGETGRAEAGTYLRMSFGNPPTRLSWRIFCYGKRARDAQEKPSTDRGRRVQSCGVHDSRRSHTDEP